jgi:heme/copper-type cytochrome/quinol oxidase subunit 4
MIQNILKFSIAFKSWVIITLVLFRLSFKEGLYPNPVILSIATLCVIALLVHFIVDDITYIMEDLKSERVEKEVQDEINRKHTHG